MLFPCSKLPFVMPLHRTNPCQLTIGFAVQWSRLAASVKKRNRHWILLRHLRRSPTSSQSHWRQGQHGFHALSEHSPEMHTRGEETFTPPDVGKCRLPSSASVCAPLYGHHVGNRPCINKWASTFKRNSLMTSGPPFFFVGAHTHRDVHLR